jgi:deoxycytidylate deaminase
VNCSKLLISAGVERIVFETAYPDAIAAELLAEAGVNVVHVPLVPVG